MILTLKNELLCKVEFTAKVCYTVCNYPCFLLFFTDIIAMKKIRKVEKKKQSKFCGKTIKLKMVKVQHENSQNKRPRNI